MRIGANLLWCGRQNRLVQSYQWTMLRPLGRLDPVVQCLEELLIDEIMITRPVRGHEDISVFENDLNIFRKLKCMTPLSISGGLRSKHFLDKLRGLAVERIAFSSVFIDGDNELIEYATKVFGRQAIQCVLPSKILNDEVIVFCSSYNSFIPLKNLDLKRVQELANEIVLVDMFNEGIENQFKFELVERFNIHPHRLIISGGVGQKTIKIARSIGIAACYIDNRSLNREAYVKRVKR